ncbi:MAG: hypothetical protein NZS48_10425 [Gemmata sp.]|nr:hypothetical protein [Gemmata sp.]
MIAQLRRLLAPSRSGKAFPEFRPLLEPLETRWMLNAAPWLARQIAPVEGTSVTPSTRLTFQPVTGELLPERGLRSVDEQRAGEFSYGQAGHYSFVYEEIDVLGSDTYVFVATGYVEYAVTAAGRVGLGTFAFASAALEQSIHVTYTLDRTMAGVTSGATGFLSFTLTFSLDDFDPVQPIVVAWRDVIDELAILAALPIGVAGAAVSLTGDGGYAWTYDETSVLTWTHGVVQREANPHPLSTGQESYTLTGLFTTTFGQSAAGTFTVTLAGTRNGSGALVGLVTGDDTGTTTFTLTQTALVTAQGLGLESFSNHYDADAAHSLSADQYSNAHFIATQSYLYAEQGTGSFHFWQEGHYDGNLTLTAMALIEEGHGTYTFEQRHVRSTSADVTSTDRVGTIDPFGRQGQFTSQSRRPWCTRSRLWT